MSRSTPEKDTNELAWILHLGSLMAGGWMGFGAGFMLTLLVDDIQHEHWTHGSVILTVVILLLWGSIRCLHYSFSKYRNWW